MWSTSHFSSSSLSVVFKSTIAQIACLFCFRCCSLPHRLIFKTASNALLYCCSIRILYDNEPEMIVSLVWGFYRTLRIHHRFCLFLQALRRRNLATFRNLAQQRLHHGQKDLGGPGGLGGLVLPSSLKSQAFPMIIQGIRTNSNDPDAHVILFDTEGA